MLRQHRTIVEKMLQAQSWGHISDDEIVRFLAAYDRVPALHALWSHNTIERITFVLAVAALIDVSLDPTGRHLEAAAVVCAPSSAPARARREAARDFREAARLVEKHGGPPGLVAWLHRLADVRQDLTVARYPTRPVTPDNALIYALAAALEVLPGGAKARYRRVAEIATQWTGRSVPWQRVKNRLTVAKRRQPVAWGTTIPWLTLLGNLLYTRVLPLTTPNSPSAQRIWKLILHPDVGIRFAVPITTPGGRVMAEELRKRGPNPRFTAG